MSLEAIFHVDKCHSLLADTVVIFHFLYVIFAVGGQVVIMIGWISRWQFIRLPAFRIVHLIAVTLVAIEAAIGMICPLTEWEYSLRQSAGQLVDRDLSFIARLVRMIIFYDFPPWVFTAMHISFGFMVMITFILVPPRFRRKGCP
jgi:hypothetical protein